MVITMNPLLDIDAVASKLNVCKLTVRRWWYAGEIPAPTSVSEFPVGPMMT